MISVKDLRSLLEAHGVRPKRSLGQNFLIDGNLARKLIDASGVGAGDLVLEIGPGAGSLTIGLLERGCRVIAAELDERLADLLEDTLVEEAPGRLTVVRGDCLASKRELAPHVVEALGGRHFRVVANLPYNIASPLIAIILMRHPECDGLWVTVQKEVADRLGASPGSKEYGELTVVVQALATVERIATVPPSCFWPPPKVTSAMIAVRRRSGPQTTDPEGLRRFARRLFASRRKQLGAILREDAPAEWPAGVNAAMRPEQLEVETIETLRRLCASDQSK